MLREFRVFPVFVGSFRTAADITSRLLKKKKKKTAIRTAALILHLDPPGQPPLRELFRKQTKV